MIAKSREPNRFRAISSAVERFVHIEDVSGSNPLSPTMNIAQTPWLNCRGVLFCEAIHGSMNLSFRAKLREVQNLGSVGQVVWRESAIGRIGDCCIAVTKILRDFLDRDAVRDHLDRRAVPDGVQGDVAQVSARCGG